MIEDVAIIFRRQPGDLGVGLALVFQMRLFFALALGSLLLASCDRTQLHQSSGSREAGGSLGDAATSETIPDSGAAPDDSGSGVTYAGVVLATTNQFGTANTYGASAEFTSGDIALFQTCPSNGASAGSCCCSQGIGLPRGPQQSAPEAGTVRLTSAGGTSTLATLTPPYGTVESQPWNPGDALGVSATGNQVHPFSGTLQTGAFFSGVTPAIGPGPLVIDRTQDFEVSWTPEGRSNERVFLRLEAGGLYCYCTAVPDLAAKLTMDSTLVSQFANEVFGTILLERAIASATSSDNATISLVHRVVQTGEVTFQ